MSNFPKNNPPNGVGAFEQITRERVDHLTEEFRIYQQKMNGSLDEIRKELAKLNETFNKDIRRIFNQMEAIKIKLTQLETTEEVEEDFEHNKIKHKKESKLEKWYITIITSVTVGLIVYIITSF